MHSGIRGAVVVVDFSDRGDPNIYVFSREGASKKGEMDDNG